MNPREQFASNLVEARSAAGLTQEELGDRVGLDRTEISLLERQGRDPRLLTIARLARGLEIPASALLKHVE